MMPETKVKLMSRTPGITCDASKDDQMKRQSCVAYCMKALPHRRKTTGLRLGGGMWNQMPLVGRP